MRTRLVISAMLVAIYGIFRSFYTTNVRYMVEAQLAPLQVGNDNIQYGLSRALTIADFVSAFVTLLLLSGLMFMWLTFYLSQSELKVEPSRIDRFFMRQFPLSETAVMPAHTQTTETAVSVPTATSEF